MKIVITNNLITKRLISLVLSLTIVFSLLTPTTAMGADTTYDTIYFEDGSYIITEMTVYNYARSYYIRGVEKKYTYYVSDIPRWAFTVVGDFTYEEGVSATCTYASYRTSIYDATWVLVDRTCTAFHNMAIAYANAERYVNGSLAYSIRDISISIVCDSYGNVQ